MFKNSWCSTPHIGLVTQCGVTVVLRGSGGASRYDSVGGG